MDEEKTTTEGGATEETTAVATIEPPAEGGSSAGQGPSAEATEGEQAISQGMNSLREFLSLDFTGVEGDPDKYTLRKLKGRDLKKFREIVLDALDEVQRIREGQDAADAANEPARIAIRAAVEANERREAKGEAPMPLPEVAFRPVPDSGMQIGKALVGKVLDRFVFDDDSWLADLLEGEEDPDDLDLDWYLCAVERLVERDDFPNLLARHLRIYQVFSNALKTKSAPGTGAQS